MNEVVRDFLVGGGCLDGIRGIEAVLEALRIERDIEGFDHELVMQSERQAAGGEVRAIWDPTVLSLALQAGGERGAREINFSAGGRPRGRRLVRNKHTTRTISRKGQCKE